MDLHRKFGKVLQGFLLAALLFAGTSFKVYGEGGLFSLKRLNPAFIEYVEKLKSGQLSVQGAEGYKLGYIPPPLDLSFLKGKNILSAEKVGVAAYPDDFDLRDAGRVSSVKDQGIHGTCWAFGAYASLESWLLTDEVVEFDFSENNMANLHGFDYPLGGFDDPNIGGNGLMSTAYLARWDGPVWESDDPYSAYDGSRIGASTGLEEVRRHVQNVIFLMPREDSLDNTAIKNAVETYGAVNVGLYMDYLTYYNPTYHSYYCPPFMGSNHGVAIVGWDDNFPASNFNTPAPGDGAFIVKNSWGTTFGESGYFYVSYYDLIGGDYLNFVFNNAEPASNYSSVYQYDPLGLIGATDPEYIVSELESGGVPSEITSTIYTDRIRFANIFTATADQSIAAVGFYALNIPMDYTVTVYTGVTAGEPESGTPASTKSGTTANFGYQTIVLDTPAPVASGELFSVVVRLVDTFSSPAVALEGPVPDYSSTATAEVGQSFTGFEHTFMLLPSPYWLDTDTDDVEGQASYTDEDVNVCLKAYTAAAPAEPVLHVAPTTLDFGVAGAETQTFDISNIGTGILTWDIGATVYNEGSGWITGVLPASGQCIEDTDTITVTVDRDLLDYGVSTALIPVTSNGGTEDVEVSIRRKAPPAKPVNISPANGATNVSRTPVLTASEYSDPDDDPMLVARWRIKKDGEIVWNSNNVSNSIEVTAGTILNYSTTYTWQVRYANSYGLESEWSDETSFTTRAKPQTNPNSPINIIPANLATGVALNPILTASGFSDPDGDAMNDSHWRIRTETEAYEIASVWEAENAGATNSIVVTTALALNTRYFWQVRYQDTDGLWSAWSTETMFITLTGSEDDEDDGEGDWVEGGSSGGGCFIATAAYGTPMAAEVVKLKNFRDSHLLKNRVGQAFVKWYYRHSPPVAEYIRQRKAAKMLVRAGLRPLLWILSF